MSLSCAVCIFHHLLLCARHLWQLVLVLDALGFMSCVPCLGHDKARGALHSALPEVTTETASHSTR